MRVLPERMLAVWLLLGGDDPFTEGLRAYREGRFQQALAAFTEAETAAGADASPALLYDKALAALRIGELALAEASVEKAADRGGAEFEALRDFLRGNVAFLRCEQAAMQASGPEAEPFAFDVAIALADTARRSWQLAAASRPDWPAARRNVERALVQLAELEKKKEEAQRKAELNAKKEPDPAPESAPEGRPQPQATERPSLEPQSAELSPEELARLFEKLEAKEKEKLELRKRKQEERAEVEKDW